MKGKLLADILLLLPGQTLLKALRHKINDENHERKFTGNEMIRRLDDIMTEGPKYRRLTDCRPSVLYAFLITLIKEKAAREERILTGPETLQVAVLQDMLEKEINTELCENEKH